jgi:hypothetical protein
MMCFDLLAFVVQPAKRIWAGSGRFLSFAGA